MLLLTTGVFFSFFCFFFFAFAFDFVLVFAFAFVFVIFNLGPDLVCGSDGAREKGEKEATRSETNDSHAGNRRFHISSRGNSTHSHFHD